MSVGSGAILEFIPISLVGWQGVGVVTKKNQPAQLGFQQHCPPHFRLPSLITCTAARRIFECNHLTVIGLPTDAEGIDTEALEELIRSCPQQQRPRYVGAAGHAASSCPCAHISPTHPPRILLTRLLYTVPVHNNPSAATLSPRRRHHLVRLAHEYSFTVVADEVYQMLTFPGRPEPPPPLRLFEAQYLQQQQQRRLSATQTGSSGSRVVSLGSFSKILAPGLRLG